MAKTKEVEKWTVMSVVAAAVIILKAATVAAEPQVPCFYIFGDSLIDNGNNNDKLTIAKVNFLPYGIDFPLGPTGRFSNGKTIADLIAEFLGFEDFIQPYATARGNQILRGINYASAAGGIRPETGRHWGERISFDGQLRNFNNTVAQLAAILGNEGAASHYLGKCIFFSALGNNDFLNNYLNTKFYDTSRRYTLPQYISLLIKQYTSQLKVLYDHGARKVALVGTSPLGCIPFTIALRSKDGKCIEGSNRASQMFNVQLRANVDVFNRIFPGAQFILVDGYNPINDILINYEAYGFKVKDKACCGRSSTICFPNDVKCPNRSEYVYWDFAHPTEAACKLIARRVYAAQKPSDAYPFDISRLARL
ncbi:GDSL esterase/lipase-like protein [Salvia divinorum]|uniref:GDSL esterase/lipase-like protein n=1 Tax=Salvia divinorum TaxID=28513 RepID=A0ABD1HHM1_SALDI